MKNAIFLMLLVLLVLTTSCTANEIDVKQNEPQKTSVDVTKIKPPTGG